MRIQTKSMHKKYIANFFQNNSKYRNIIPVMKKNQEQPRTTYTIS